jgi:hypothetical protein
MGLDLDFRVCGLKKKFGVNLEDGVEEEIWLKFKGNCVISHSVFDEPACLECSHHCHMAKTMTHHQKSQTRDHF